VRSFLFLVICFNFLACNNQQRWFYLLSELEKDVLKHAYFVGDTVHYYYSEKLITDTFHYVVEPPKAFLERAYPIETNSVEHDEQYQQTLRNLDGKYPIVLTIGTGWINNSDGYPYNKFYIEAGGFYEEYLQSFVNHLPDTVTFQFGAAHDPQNYDRIIVRYSHHQGMIELSDSVQSIFFKRLP